MAEAPTYLLDVNILIARSDENHLHHRSAKQWFHSRDLKWALCSFSEAGFLRYTARAHGFAVRDAALALSDLKRNPGYHYQPVDGDWHTLTRPFSERIFGHNQITDALLLGLAIRHDLILVTFDRAILHMAAGHLQHVLLLEA